MKWIDKRYEKSQNQLDAGTRVINKFCFVPYRVENKVYWLESISISQKLFKGPRGDYFWKDTYVV